MASTDGMFDTPPLLHETERGRAVEPVPSLCVDGTFPLALAVGVSTNVSHDDEAEILRLEAIIGNSTTEPVAIKPLPKLYLCHSNRFVMGLFQVI